MGVVVVVAPSPKFRVARMAFQVFLVCSFERAIVLISDYFIFNSTGSEVLYLEFVGG
jgi:hypothetical protein